MILYFGLGVLMLVAGLWLLRLLAKTDPAKLAQSARWLAWVAGATVLLVLFVFLLTRGRLAQAVVDLVALVPVLVRMRTLWWRRHGASAASTGQTSEVETDTIRMRLDHDTGTMSGTVRKGRFQGRRLDELTQAELAALWHECRAEDAPAASLLETYLDRLMPGWREAGAGGGGAASSRASDAMTRGEAYDILGLGPGATEAEIREAHHRLMMKVHPDQGGSTYLAAKLNRAREVLLGG
jgi:hypothetical protein